MKFQLVKSDTKVYVPKTLTIAFESVEEERGFRHLIMCHPLLGPSSCSSTEEVKNMLTKLTEPANQMRDM